MTQESFEELLEAYLPKKKRLNLGEVVEGRVLFCDKHYVYVDAGVKEDVVFPLEEFPEGCEEGQTLKGIVVAFLPEEQIYLLSKKELEKRNALKELERAFKEKRPVKIEIKRKLEKGFEVFYKGILPGFLPFSLSYFKIGTYFKEVKEGEEREAFIEKIERGRFVANCKKIFEEEYKTKKEKILDLIEKGEKLKGKVKKQVKGGFIIEIDEVISGFLPYSELSWARIKEPEKMFKEGDEVEVKPIFFDKAKERIKFSIKRLFPDPWEKVEEIVKEGEVIKGKVVKTGNFGAFVEIQPGIEGLIPYSELSWRRTKVEDVVKEEDLVEAVVLKVNKDEKKILLSLKRLVPSPWEEFVSRHKPGDIVQGIVKKIEPFGIFVEIDEGVRGFVHVSNISWEEKDPQKLFKEGDLVQAVILEIDREKRRISLSLKHLEEDPFKVFTSSHKVGDIVTSKILEEIKGKGYRLSLAKGVYAFLPLKDFEGFFEEKPHFKEGDNIKVKIIEIDEDKRKIRVSYRAYKKEEEEKELKEYISQKRTSGFTLGELLKQVLNKGKIMQEK